MFPKMHKSHKAWLGIFQTIRESPSQFENLIMPWVYIRSILRSTTKKLHSGSQTGVWKISSVACGFSSVKIDYSDYPKKFNLQIMFFSILKQFMCFSIKYYI